MVLEISNLPRVPNFTPFCSTANLFELQAILRQVHQMTSKWRWTLKDRKYFTYMLQLPATAKFHFISLYSQPFSSNRPFETTAQNDPKMTVNTKRSKVPHIHVITTPESQNSLRFPYGQPVSSYMSFETSAPNDLKMTLNTKGQKYFTCYNYPRLPNFTSYLFTASRFRVNENGKKS